MSFPDERPAAFVLANHPIGGTGRPAGRSRDWGPVDGIGKRAPLGLPCHRHDPNLWFAEAPHELEIAKGLCGPCPVRQACLAGALRRKEPYGVWGGEIVIAGRVIPRKRPRGRPRKDSSAVGPRAPTLIRGGPQSARFGRGVDVRRTGRR